MHQIILLIGGNEGNTHEYIAKAKAFIEKKIGKIVKESSIVESEPWGFEHAQNFLNQVIEVESSLTPHETLKNGQEIEKTLGRKAKTTTGYEGRPMDIDILFYDNLEISEEDLTIPHPRMHERKFTMVPLAEKWNNYIHPTFRKTMKQLLDECNDDGWIKIRLKFATKS
ncbi:2-amino-4-hydroxy-6-hydroxymethyldihydropteridine diphosphokinase [Labilibacter sediminis]|nr:2-amino-4-hydroxy-6-hydroxymethyldihydropteridine diphosphokinase [Labilibacter sediminis]